LQLSSWKLQPKAASTSKPFSANLPGAAAAADDDDDHDDNDDNDNDDDDDVSFCFATLCNHMTAAAAALALAALAAAFDTARSTLLGSQQQKSSADPRPAVAGLHTCSSQPNVYYESEPAAAAPSKEVVALTGTGGSSSQAAEGSCGC
jgi:hypothetical protein